MNQHYSNSPNLKTPSSYSDLVSELRFKGIMSDVATETARIPAMFKAARTDPLA